MNHTGFTDYVTTGKITQSFINDFRYHCLRSYRQWTLFIPFEEYYSQCWERLMERLPNFDPKIASIQTLCISTANNECWRLYMKNKILLKHPEDDIDEPEVNYDLGHSESNCDFLLLKQIIGSYGVDVREEDLISSYDNESIVGQCLMWLKIKNERMVCSD